MSKKIFALTIRFKALNNTIIPPFSAKVSKLIMHKLSPLYKEVMGSNSPFKPVAITPLMHNGRALIKMHEDKGNLTLRAGEHYCFRATIIVEESVEPSSIFSFEQQRVDGIFKASILLDSIMLDVKDFANLTLGRPSRLKIDFISPVLLQLPSYGRFMHGRHLLFPLPSIIVRSLLDHWNANCGPDDVIRRGMYLQVYSNYALMEADFNIKPVTAYYDDVRKPRGFIGWVVYEVRARRRGRNAYNDLMRLLDYARYVGIGRSRATGFGQIELLSL
jgi:CRISPR-associated endoribonuclease Cas6